LDIRKSIRIIKKLSDEVLLWLSVWSEVQIAYGPPDALHPKTPSSLEQQTGFIFPIPAYPSCAGKEAVKQV